MSILKSVQELEALRASIKNQKSEDFTHRNPIEIRVAMATCGIASGAKTVFDFLVEELPKRNIQANVIKTGCMGYCYAEPTLEITKPGEEPMVFGYVDVKKADEIIEKFIKTGALVDGIIPINYELAT